MRRSIFARRFIFARPCNDHHWHALCNALANEDAGAAPRIIRLL